jgi:type I restriction enzyme, R subunit
MSSQERHLQEHLIEKLRGLKYESNILENYAQIVEEKDQRTGKKKRKQVWPRYHQLGVVRQALSDVHASGAGKRYLIQHSAGSGKSN